MIDARSRPCVCPGRQRSLAGGRQRRPGPEGTSGHDASDGLTVFSSPPPRPPPRRDAPDAGPPGRLRVHGVREALPPAQPPPRPHAGSLRYLPAVPAVRLPGAGWPPRWPSLPQPPAGRGPGPCRPCVGDAPSDHALDAPGSHIRGGFSPHARAVRREDEEPVGQRPPVTGERAPHTRVRRPRRTRSRLGFPRGPCVAPRRAPGPLWAGWRWTRVPASP